MTDTTDALVGRLRAHVEKLGNTTMNLAIIHWNPMSCDFLEAADTIAAQAARIAALEGALRRVRENYIDPFAVPDDLLTEIDSALGASR